MEGNKCGNVCDTCMTYTSTRRPIDRKKSIYIIIVILIVLMITSISDFSKINLVHITRIGITLNLLFYKVTYKKKKKNKMKNVYLN